MCQRFTQSAAMQLRLGFIHVMLQGLIKSVTCCMIGEYTPDHDSRATMLCT